MGCEIDGYAYINICSDITGMCRMGKKFVNMCFAYRGIKKTRFRCTTLHTRDIH